LHPSDPEPLIGFHLSLPMGFVKSAPFFCATTETMANLSNHLWGMVDLAPAHPLEQFTLPPEPGISAPPLYPELMCYALAYIDVFIANFLAL
jgi:hypothetical protein